MFSTHGGADTGQLSATTHQGAGRRSSKALARHAAFDIADSPPRIQPRAEGSERGQIRAYTSGFQRDEEQDSREAILSHELESDVCVSPYGRGFGAPPR